jgi:DNA-binding Xre family transcriptional regulator
MKKQLKSKDLSIPEKNELYNQIKRSVKELNLIKQGKLEAIPARKLLHELRVQRSVLKA